LAAASGMFVGVLAGLVVLGGAEERMPFILYGLKVPLYDMIIANLIISLGTSGFNLALRANAGLLPQGALYISLAMIVGSLAGAYLGAVLSHRMAQRRLKALIAIVLSLVVVRLVVDIAGVGASAAFPSFTQYPLAVFFGLLIGVVSGSIGVAGGEYRIPVLLYGFGLPLKVAGTASQLVSVPTILAALARHRVEHPFSRRALTLAAVMGIPSLAGVAVSQVLLNLFSADAIRLVFILILLYTIVRLSLELAQPGEEGTM
jgi:uncharacterized membrane protein YfcA